MAPLHRLVRLLFGVLARTLVLVLLAASPAGRPVSQTAEEDETTHVAQVASLVRHAGVTQPPPPRPVTRRVRQRRRRRGGRRTMRSLPARRRLRRGVRAPRRAFRGVISTDNADDGDSDDDDDERG